MKTNFGGTCKLWNAKGKASDNTTNLKKHKTLLLYHTRISHYVKLSGTALYIYYKW